MYGSIFRMRPLPGHEKDLFTLAEQWQIERRPNVKGFVAEYIFRPDARSEELVGVVIFESHETYQANAGDPAEDAWYRRLREYLTADPTWEDGAVISATSPNTAAKV